MANILLEYLRRIDERYYKTGREHRQFLGELTKALDEIWKIRKATPNEALKCLENLGGIEISHTESDRDEDSNGDWVYDTITVNDGSIKELYYKDFNNVRQALIQVQEKNDKDTAFDLINEKDVDIKLLKWAYPSLEAYNVKVRTEKEYWWREELTMEEFQFLGRMVGAI